MQGVAPLMGLETNVYYPAESGLMSFGSFGVGTPAARPRAQGAGYSVASRSKSVRDSTCVCGVWSNAAEHRWLWWGEACGADGGQTWRHREREPV